jgi:putative DNA primase/helicase
VSVPEGYQTTFEWGGADLDELVVPAPSNPMAVARQFVAERYTSTTGDALLVYHRGGFYVWDGRCWPEAEDGGIRASLYRWLEHAMYWRRGRNEPEPVSFEPTKAKVANAIESLQVIGHLAQSVDTPAWLGEAGDRPPAREMVAMENGLLHLPTRTLFPHTPAFFSEHALPFAYEVDAPPPERWLGFLAELWPDDEQSPLTLAEIIGYLLSGRTDLQKIFGLVGPKRGGKGVIARVTSGLLGVHNTAAPTLSSLTTGFGLAPLVGKPLATISDARLGSRADNLIAVERLLSISGEDYITVDRKYRDAWTGKLPTRFLILSNEIPHFTDASGALASRFVLLTLSRSFYGHEDPLLTDRLLAEASGIFNWALQGLERLLERGYFEQPSSALAALRRLEDLSSPVGAFVRDECEIGPGLRIAKDDLWNAWKEWTNLEGGRPGTKAVFIKDLIAAYPEVRPRRAGIDGDRRQVLDGIQLRQQNNAEPPLTTPDAADVRQGSSGVGSIRAPEVEARNEEPVLIEPPARTDHEHPE